jgi:hypothetical protein
LHTSTPSGSWTPIDAVAQRELRGVLVLVLARVHVEVDAAELGVAAHHVVGDDVLVPRLGVGGRRVLDVVDRAGDVEQALQRLLVREVRADLLGVDRVLGDLDPVLEEGLLPVLDDLGALVDGLTLLEQLGVVLGGALLGQLGDALDEVGGGLARLDHLVFGDVVGPVVEAEQHRLLGAQAEHLAEDLLVAGVAAPRAELDVQLLRRPSSSA